METRRFLNQSQPQTLVGAQFLLYLNAVFAVLSLLAGGVEPFVLVTILGGYAAYGIANDKNWGYYGGIAVSIVRLLSTIFLISERGPSLNTIVGFAFALLLVYLLLHPMSREYKRIWFK